MVYVNSVINKTIITTIPGINLFSSFPAILNLITYWFIARPNIFIVTIAVATPSGILPSILNNTVSTPRNAANTTLASAVFGDVTGSVAIKKAPKNKPPLKIIYVGYQIPPSTLSPIKNVVINTTPIYTSGIHKDKKTTMVISRGIGKSVFPFRINNRPEFIYK